MTLYIVIVLQLLMVGVGVAGWRKFSRVPSIPEPHTDYQAGLLAGQMAQTVEVIGELCETIAEVRADLPGKVLQSIQASINPRKGKVGELVTMLQLTSEYQRIIPLGQPVDMIGIGEDTIDFIEVKSGKSTLSTMERKIKALVDDGKVRYIVVRPNIEIGGQDD